MHSRFKIFIFIGILSLFGAEAFARDVVLQIAFTDQFHERIPQITETEHELNEIYPDDKVVTITVRTGPTIDLMGNEHIRRRAIEKMENLELEPGEKIKALVIQMREGTDVREDSTELAFIGKIKGQVPDEDFTDFFAPLAGRFAKGAAILLNDCHSFCGANEGATNRAHAFLHLLGVDDGTLYGAVYTPPKKSLLNPKHMALYMTGGVVVGEFLFVLNSIINPGHFFDFRQFPVSVLNPILRMTMGGGGGFTLSTYLFPFTHTAHKLKMKFTTARRYRFQRGAKKLTLMEEKIIDAPAACETMLEPAMPMLQAPQESAITSPVSSPDSPERSE